MSTFADSSFPPKGEDEADFVLRLDCPSLYFRTYRVVHVLKVAQTANAMKTGTEVPASSLESSHGKLKWYPLGT